MSARIRGAAPEAVAAGDANEDGIVGDGKGEFPATDTTQPPDARKRRTRTPPVLIVADRVTNVRRKLE